MEWVSENKMFIIGAVVVLLIIRWLFKDLLRRWFASYQASFSNNISAKLEEVKKDVFATLGSVVSHDPALRKIGALKILEIGAGSGTNFQYYPDGTRLTVVDPNPYFASYYNENKKKFQNIQAEDIIVTKGEEMDIVPDNSMDVVVVTRVFCSVTNTEKMLKQILRVLVPGGKFYFYEHVHEFDIKKHSTRRKLQTILTATGIWPLIFDGCKLNRDMLKAVEKTGFSKVEARYFYTPIDEFLFKVCQASLSGVAEK